MGQRVADQVRRGAKLRYTEALAERVLANVALGCTVQEAALCEGVSPDTVYRWVKGESGASANFATRLDAARSQRSRAALGVILKSALGVRDPQTLEILVPPSWRAAAAFLDRTDDRYRKTHRAEVSGAGSGPVQSRSTVEMAYTGPSFGNLSPQERVALDRLLARAENPTLDPEVQG